METTFNAWEVTRYGAPEVLAPVSRPVPTPTANQVLIRIRASAVSRADGLMRAGKPKFARLFLGLKRPRAGLSGTCFAGEIVAIGSEVTRFNIGDAVFVGDLVRGKLVGKGPTTHFFMCDLEDNQRDIRTVIDELSPNAVRVFPGHFDMFSIDALRDYVED